MRSIKTDYEELICQDCGQIFSWIGQSTKWDINQEESQESINRAWERAKNHVCEEKTDE